MDTIQSGPTHHSNRIGRELNEMLISDENLSLSTPKGLHTQKDPVSAQNSTLDLLFIPPSLIPKTKTSLGLY